MNSAASNIIASGYVAGFFDVLDTLLSGKTQFTLGDLDDLHPRDLTELLSRPTAMRLQAGMKTGGGILLLFGAGDVGNIMAAASGQPLQNPDSPTAADLSSIKEVFDPCMGGGVSHFKEAFGAVVELGDVAVLPCAPAAAQELASLLGPNVTVAPFHFSASPAAQGDAVLLFSQTLEGIVPPERLGAMEDSSTPSLLSEEELSSILSGFESGKSTPSAPSPMTPPMPMQAAATHAAPAVRPAPSNLDIVLDIRLTATARLGRIQMLVSDILSLGPGSIIDVGHAVDEPVELLVNDRLIARGDVVVVDEKFGLRITEIVAPQQRIESLR